MIELQCGAAQCRVYPALGGSLGMWSVDGQPMLRAATADDVSAADPLRLSGFPLVPYSNRIGQGSFVWENETIQLARNFAPEPHAIHGVGWQRAWDVTAQTETSVTLAYQHDADARWPWPHRAEQEFLLSETSLTLRLRARNDHTGPVPLAFGHHPYFDSADARLTFAAREVWETGADMLPTEAHAPSDKFDFSAGEPVNGRALDHCYTGWNGVARIDWMGRCHALDISATPNLTSAVVYIPSDGDAFCFEPVPHMNNALNRSERTAPMPVIAPGAWFEADIVLNAVPAQA